MRVLLLGSCGCEGGVGHVKRTEEAQPVIQGILEAKEVAQLAARYPSRPDSGGRCWEERPIFGGNQDQVRKDEEALIARSTNRLGTEG